MPTLATYKEGMEGVNYINSNSDKTFRIVNYPPSQF